MKLNPPGSSSDLEVARAIARRLHQRAFADEPPAAGVASSTVASRSRPTPPPLPPRARPAPAPATPGPAPRHEPPPVQPSAQQDREQRVERGGRADQPSHETPRAPGVREPEAWKDAPAEPEAWRDEPAGPEPRPQPGKPERPPWMEEPEAGPDASWRAETPSVGSELEDLSGMDEEDGGAPDDALAELTGGPDIETDLEELGPDEPASVEAPAAASEVSPEDLIASAGVPDEWSESALDVDVAEGDDTSPEDLFEVTTPSWDDVAETCLGLAGARGAMLVDGAGQILAARGDWPNPGPEAIAARLVAMMERALRDAPTRSVSAPLAGQHLTAWRVPVGEDLLTAVFMGEAPLKADVRPAIDDVVRRAAGG